MFGTLNTPAVKPLHFSPPASPCSPGGVKPLQFSPPASPRSPGGSRQIRCAVSVAVPKPMTAPGSLYEILKVDPSATVTEIKSAYRSLAKMYHPDMSGEGRSDGEDFMAIHNAYSTLSDPAARSVYDLSLLANNRRRLAASFGYSGRTPTRRWETDQCW